MRDAHRGGTRGTGIRHVEDGDPRLADLLLEFLPDAFGGFHQVPGGEYADVLDPHAGVGQGAAGGLGCEIHLVEIGMLAELRHMDPENPDRIAHRLSVSDVSATGAKP